MISEEQHRAESRHREQSNTNKKTYPSIRVCGLYQSQRYPQTGVVGAPLRSLLLIALAWIPLPWKNLPQSCIYNIGEFDAAENSRKCNSPVRSYSLAHDQSINGHLCRRTRREAVHFLSSIDGVLCSGYFKQSSKRPYHTYSSTNYHPHCQIA